MRVATITVIVSDSDPVLVTLSQDGTNPTLSVAPSNQNVNSDAGNIDFAVTSNSDWTASSDVSWCSITSAGSGSETLIANYTENESTSSRIATITVSVTGVSPVQVTLNQAGATPTLSVTPPVQYVDYLTGITDFLVNTNSTWTAISDVEWCTVTPSGDGNGTITAIYEANNETNERKATISVSVADASTVDVFVEQSPLVGIEDYNIRTIQVNPNPSTGHIKVCLSDKQTIKEIEIKDLTGKIIFYSRGLNEINNSIDLSGNAQGCYIIKVKTMKETITSRIIIRK